MDSTQARNLSDICPVSGQSYFEDLVCAGLQTFGLLLALGGTATMISLAGVYGDARRIVAISIYGVSLILVYGASALYHFARDPARKRVLKTVDHAIIHLLIAGTYTPFVLVTLQGGWGWSLFGVVWGLSVVGMALKIFAGDRFRILPLLIYLGMGWVGVVAVVPLVEKLGIGGLLWMVLGGSIYSAGVIFYLWDRLRFNHLVFQLFVLGGSVCFYFAIMFNVLF